MGGGNWSSNTRAEAKGAEWTLHLLLMLPYPGFPLCDGGGLSGIKVLKVDATENDTRSPDLRQAILGRP